MPTWLCGGHARARGVGSAAGPPRASRGSCGTAVRGVRTGGCGCGCRCGGPEPRRARARVPPTPATAATSGCDAGTCVAGAHALSTSRAPPRTWSGEALPHALEERDEQVRQRDGVDGHGDAKEARPGQPEQPCIRLRPRSKRRHRRQLRDHGVEQPLLRPRVLAARHCSGGGLQLSGHGPQDRLRQRRQLLHQHVGLGVLEDRDQGVKRTEVDVRRLRGVSCGQARGHRCQAVPPQHTSRPHRSGG